MEDNLKNVDKFEPLQDEMTGLWNEIQASTCDASDDASGAELDKESGRRWVEQMLYQHI